MTSLRWILFIFLFLLASCNTEKSLIENAFAPGSKIEGQTLETRVSVSGANALKVEWPSAAATVMSYKIFRSGEIDGTYSEIYSTASDLSFTDSNLVAGEEYFYRVEYHGNGTVSTSTPAQGIPIDDFNVTSITPSNGRVDFIFPTVPGATSYSVRFGTSSGVYGLETPITSGGFLSGLSNGATYYFQLRAKNSFGGVDANSEVTTLMNSLALHSLEFTTEFAPGTNSADAAFSTQAIVTARNAGGVILTTDSTSPLTLTAFSSVGCSGPIVTGGLSGDTTKTLVNGVATFTNVRALKTSVKSIRVSAGSVSACSTDLTVTAGVPTQIFRTSGNAQSALLSSALAQALTVTVKDASDNLVENATVNWAAASGTLGGATSSTNASGVAQMTLTTGSSAGVKTVSATIDGTATAVSFDHTVTVPAPTSLTGAVADTGANLSFTAAAGATSYNVYRSTSSGSGMTLVTNIATTTYSDSGLINGTTYYFTVKAVNNSIESSASNEVSVRPAVIPSAPQTLAATQESTQTVLTWSPHSVGTGPLSYAVYRSSTSGSGFSKLVDELATPTYTDTGLENGLTYYYKVTASNILGEGSASTEISVTPEYPSTLQFDFAGNSTFFPHNTLDYSEGLNSSSWSKAQITIRANAAMAPDGTFTADKVTATAVSSDHYVQQGFSVQSGHTYTASVYLKKGERTTASLILGYSTLWTSATLPTAVVNLATGTITSTSSTAISSITPVGRDWYRVSITATPIASGNTALRIQYSGSGTGNEINGFYAWGAQAEANPGVSRYVSTNASAKSSFASPLLPSKGTATLNFSRADTAPVATHFGSNGLLRIAPHNKITRSEEINLWSFARTLVSANATTAPDGTTTADKLIETSSTVGGMDHAAYRTAIPIDPGGVYTFSVFLKAAERSKCSIVMGDTTWSNTDRMNIDLAAGTIISNAPNGSINVLSRSLVHVGNGWYRASLSTSLPLATTTGMASVYILNNSGGGGYVGDDTSGIYVWGAQYEKNLHPSTYVPTAATVSYSSPRFDFDPLTRTPKGLLIEQSHTNLITYAEQFEHADWQTKSGVTVTADATTAPDGTMSADKIVEDATAGVDHKIVRGNVSITTGVTYTASAYFKAAGRTVMNMQLSASARWPVSNPSMSVNLSTCTINTTTNALRSSIASVGNGWCRLSITQTAITTGVSGININLMNPGTVYNGDGVSGIYAWGAQLEVDTQPTSYIKTVGATALRASELASFSAGTWYTTSGTWGLKWAHTAITTSVGSVLSTSLVTSGFYYMRGSSVNLGLRLISEAGLYDNSPDVQGFLITAPTALSYNATFAFAPGDITLSYSGGPLRPAVATLVNPSVFYLGAQTSAGVNSLNGTIESVRFFNSRLPDPDVIRLSQ